MRAVWLQRAAAVHPLPHLISPVRPYPLYPHIYPQVHPLNHKIYSTLTESHFFHDQRDTHVTGGFVAMARCLRVCLYACMLYHSLSRTPKQYPPSHNVLFLASGAGTASGIGRRP